MARPLVAAYLEEVRESHDSENGEQMNQETLRRTNSIAGAHAGATALVAAGGPRVRSTAPGRTDVRHARDTKRRR